LVQKHSTSNANDSERKTLDVQPGKHNSSVETGAHHKAPGIRTKNQLQVEVFPFGFNFGPCIANGPALQVRRGLLMELQLTAQWGVYKCPM